MVSGFGVVASNAMRFIYGFCGSSEGICSFCARFLRPKILWRLNFEDLAVKLAHGALDLRRPPGNFQRWGPCVGVTMESLQDVWIILPVFDRLFLWDASCHASSLTGAQQE